jgi:hypothetical protein
MEAMKWLALWLLLAGTYLLGLLATQALVSGRLEITREMAAHLLAIPLAQLAALRLVAWLRQAFRPGQ